MIGIDQVPARMTGVPERVPDELRVTPSGNGVVALHVYGADPPDASNVPETDEPMVATGREVVVMETEGGTWAKTGDARRKKIDKTPAMEINFIILNC